MANTFDDYIKAVRSQYEVEKNKVYSSFLLQPSPAQIRELCLLIHDKGLSNKDKEVFELFFKPKPDCELRKAIENIDVEKFKKICNFLNEKSQSTSQSSLNLIAILVNYQLRPFSLFLVSDIIEAKKEEKDINKPTSVIEVKIEDDEFKSPELKSNLKKKLAFGFLGLIGLTTIGYTAKNIIIPDPQCMQWQNNHYEVVDCNSGKQSLLKQYDIIPYDENQSKLIKIEVSDTTTFFKNGKSLYWYCKVKGKPEFFNTHGEHPETGKALKPVSNYIIEKYVKKD